METPNIHINGWDIPCAFSRNLFLLANTCFEYVLHCDSWSYRFENGNETIESLSARVLTTCTVSRSYTLLTKSLEEERRVTLDFVVIEVVLCKISDQRKQKALTILRSGVSDVIKIMDQTHFSGF